MLAKLQEKSSPLTKLPARPAHILCLLPTGEAWHDAPGSETVIGALRRSKRKPSDLAKTPLAVQTPEGHLTVWLRLDPTKPSFERQALLRKAVMPLLEEHPGEVHLAAFGEAGFRRQALREATYVTWLNGIRLPVWKKEDEPHAPLKRIVGHGAKSPDGLARERAVAEGNALCRELTWLPPNLLDPAAYRARIRDLAKGEGWRIEEYDLTRLRKMKAGAFLAVARGSRHEDAAIVRLRWEGGKGKGRGKVALVGKGICFDTGGHNLKPARYMHNMHDDMNGSAVCLGLLTAATRLGLPLHLDVWLAIAENHLSPEAYTQNEVVTALDGSTIEIVHTDAEGRMVLADTLTLAAREGPDLILDYATLTGSMAMAVGERMSGVIANRDELANRAVAAGQACGERVVAFPMPADYDEALESKVADVKQCILEGEADHILAARLLSRFVGDCPWLHVDLSASRCKGGLGAVGSDLTGFGVALGVELLAGQLPE